MKNSDRTVSILSDLVDVVDAKIGKRVLDKIMQCQERPDGRFDGRRKIVVHLTKTESNILFGMLTNVIEAYCSSSGVDVDDWEREQEGAR